MAETAYRIKESFVVGMKNGPARELHAGEFIPASDPLVKTHRAFLETISAHVEQMTASPGQPRNVSVPTEARGRRRGARNTKENDMPHSLPPEDENSAASPFAPFQPGAGVVADDVQDKGSGVKESEFKAPKGVDHSKDENQPAATDAVDEKPAKK